MPPAEKSPLHPRNPHRARYDFPQLVASSPALAAFVQPTGFGHDSIDFARPAAVKALNQALLRHFYGLTSWDVPAGYLCPPIPGRADYIHYLADLLAAANGGTLPPGSVVSALDIGTGASCIYPIIGHCAYGWHFVGSEVDAVARQAAQQLVAANAVLAGAIEVRPQPRPQRVFGGIVRPGECFDLTLCNPPFYASAAEAAASNRRKVGNLGGPARRVPARNFGGQATELWCPGGEAAFVSQLVAESAAYAQQGYWFTTLVSQKATLPGLYAALRRVGAVEVRTVPMAQGSKVSRFVAWSFLVPAQQAAWRAARWQ